MKRFHLATTAFLAAIFVSGAANALTCQTSDPQTLQQIFQADLQFGALNRHKYISYTPLNHKCLGVTKNCIGNGTVNGPLAYYICDPFPPNQPTPTCTGKPVPGGISSANISYTLSFTEFLVAFAGNKKRVLAACFKQLGGVQ